MDKSNLKQIKKFIKRNKVLSVFFYPLISLHGVWLKHTQIPFSEFYDFVFEKVEGGSLIIRIDSFNGVFEMSFKSHIMKRLLQFREYESWLAVLARRVVDPSKDVIDVGANVGLFTVLSADLINNDRTVLAIEPVESALGYLKANILRNKKEDKVKVYEGVASDKVGHYEMNVIPGMEEYSSLGDLVHPEIGDNTSMKNRVNGETIDNLVERYSLAPGFIKIDAEGAEHLVFRGASETLKNHQPVILSELSDNLLNTQGDTSADIFQYLMRLSYSLFNVDSLDPIDSEIFEGNFLALPANKRGLIAELQKVLKKYDS